MKDGDRLLTICEVSKKLNVPKHTLRFWEKELNGFFVPRRTKGGQRRFNDEDIVWIEDIKKLRERGVPLSEIKSKLNNGNREDHSHSKRIDLLAHRVAEKVKAEVYDFFKEEIS